MELNCEKNVRAVFVVSYSFQYVLRDQNTPYTANLQCTRHALFLHNFMHLHHILLLASSSRMTIVDEKEVKISFHKFPDVSKSNNELKCKWLHAILSNVSISSSCFSASTLQDLQNNTCLCMSYISMQPRVSNVVLFAFQVNILNLENGQRYVPSIFCQLIFITFGRPIVL